MTACVALIGCMPRETAAQYLQRRAGLTVCPTAKIAQPTEAKDTPDVSRFAFHVEGSCKSEFLRSALASPGGECAAMLPKNGACFYIRKDGVPVTVEGAVAGNDFKVTVL